MMDILQGIVIGVASGLTLALLAWIQNRFVRCDQLQYIRALIVKERERIYSSKDISGPPRYTKDEVRHAIYKDMHRQLFSAIDGRASQLTFDEKTSLTGPCWPIDWMIETHQALPPFQLYTKMFSTWEQLAWLNLPAYEGEIPTE